MPVYACIEYRPTGPHCESKMFCCQPIHARGASTANSVNSALPAEQTLPGLTPFSYQKNKTLPNLPALPSRPCQPRTWERTLPALQLVSRPRTDPGNCPVSADGPGPTCAPLSLLGHGWRRYRRRLMRLTKLPAKTVSIAAAVAAPASGRHRQKTDWDRGAVRCSAACPSVACATRQRQCG